MRITSCVTWPLGCLLFIFVAGLKHNPPPILLPPLLFPSPQQVLVCRHCQESFPGITQSELEQHEQSHRVCPFCTMICDGMEQSVFEDHVYGHELWKRRRRGVCKRLTTSMKDRFTHLRQIKLLIPTVFQMVLAPRVSSLEPAETWNPPASFNPSQRASCPHLFLVKRLSHCCTVVNIRFVLKALQCVLGVRWHF